MWGLTLILLLFPVLAQASCLDNDDPLYNLAVSQGNYSDAFHVVAQELAMPRDVQSHFKIIQGYSQQHDDRNGQADADTLDVSLDPNLFLEGKEGACQGVEHEWTHLKQFHRDREKLHAFFSSRPVPQDGWKGCDKEELEDMTPEKAEAQAYSCLQEYDLAAHAAAMEIEAVMSQIPYANQKVLRDDDLKYLLENLTNWSDHQDHDHAHR